MGRNNNANSLKPFVVHKQPRKCLKCDKMFPSAGPYNRICGVCQGKNKDSNNGLREIPTPYTGKKALGDY